MHIHNSWCKAHWQQRQDFNVCWFCAQSTDKRKHICKYSGQERNLRSYNIYFKKWYQIQPYIFVPIWRAFSKYQTALPFSSQNNDKSFQLSGFFLNLFSTICFIYTKYRQKLYRNAEPKTWYWKQGLKMKNLLLKIISKIHNY